MSTLENRVAAGNLVDLVEIVGLTNANLNMKDHFPKDVPAGRGCGIFFGLGGGVHVSVGKGELLNITESRLRLKGEFKYFGKEGPADLEIEFTGPGKARLLIPALSHHWMNAVVWKQGGDLFYKVIDGPIKDAKIKQIYANAGFFSGAYVEFHVTLQDGKYGEVKYWFHKN